MSEAVITGSTVNCRNLTEIVSGNNGKKHKHNARRRKSKKSQLSGASNVLASVTDSFDQELKVDEVVNFLYQSITNDVQGSSKSTKSINDRQNPLPSSSCNVPTSNLTDLFENLQVHTLKNPIDPKNVTEYLNVDLLKETNCKTLSAIEELEKVKQTKLHKDVKQNDNIPKNKMKDYFNLNLIRKSPEQSLIGQIESSSKRLVSELENSLYSLKVGTDDENSRKTNEKYLADYFNVKALNQQEANLVTDIRSTSKLLVSELGKTLLAGNDDSGTKNTGGRKKYRNHQIRKRPEKKLDGGFDGKQKVFLNSALGLINDGETCYEDSDTQKRKKKIGKKKRVKCENDGEDFSYPKYLSPEELESVSNYGVLLTGIIRINQKNYKEAYITAPDKGMDILIEGLKDRNRALEGDEVYFVLKTEEVNSSSRRTSEVHQRRAVVVGIKTENHSRKAVGILKTGASKGKNNSFYWFSPRDSRLPRIKLPREKIPIAFFQNGPNFQDKLYFAKILRWDDMRFAEGELVKEVGTAGSIETETTALLLKYDLDVTPYPESLNQYFPSSPFRIPVEELAKREDLRNECIFTIDPASARDLDDAVSCKKLENGHFLVGVHISDVTYFLQEGTPLDKAVSSRATTIYLVQEVYHMLPRELCQMCSLAPGEDKLSFSVFWEIAPSQHDDVFDYKIINHRFSRSVINSCAQLSYEQVQNVLDGKDETNQTPWAIYGSHSFNDMKETIIMLNKIARCLRRKRFDNGALRIDQTKICFALNEDGMPREYFVYINQESHRLIEEFMLLANVTVAEEIAVRFPRIAFLRSHSVPLGFVLEKLQKNLEKYGIILDITSAGALQSSLSKYAGEDLGSVARMLVLYNALAKPMARAKYYCAHLFPETEDRSHYALNVSLYTHFTSPIRRYADVMVHRLLSAATSYQNAPDWAVEEVHRIAANCNKQKYSAKMASESSTELFLSVYIGLKGAVISEAVVCDLKDKSFDCIVLSTGAHQRIYYEQIEARSTLQEEDGFHRLVVQWPKRNGDDSELLQVIEMFTIVKVELRKTNVLKIEAKLLKSNSGQ